jgi:glutamate--cysteine ligase
MTADAFRNLIAQTRDKSFLVARRGIEKEGLRVSRDTHRISQLPHPTALGSALTHSAITTDYSEALLEFITGVHATPESALEELFHLHAYTSQSLPDEIIWSASMPGELEGEADIPIAHYGSSNIGTMKRVYRNGLGARYGRAMQAIAGIHYNFSLPETFWELSLAHSETTLSIQDWRTQGYLALIRNFQRRLWLLNFLTGSSPAVSRSFLAGQAPMHLVEGQSKTLMSRHATSLRMGDLGYTSSAQDGLQICYNQLETYIQTLTDAIVEPHEHYASLPPTSQGELLQLNHGLLQIENEFYSAIRPKRVTQSGEAPVRALRARGIEYVEVRCLDVNPFTPLGIDVDTTALVDTFVLSCLLEDSPLCTSHSRKIDNENNQRALNQGRSPSLRLLDDEGNEQTVVEASASILMSMEATAELLDSANQTSRHVEAVNAARSKIAGDEETYSARVVRELDEQSVDYSTLMGEYSKRWNRMFQDFALPLNARTRLADEAIASLRKQREIEKSDTSTFDAFLQAFYTQYH